MAVPSKEEKRSTTPVDATVNKPYRQHPSQLRRLEDFLPIESNYRESIDLGVNQGVLRGAEPGTGRAAILAADHPRRLPAGTRGPAAVVTRRQQPHQRAP